MTSIPWSWDEDDEDKFDFELEWMKRVRYRSGEWGGEGIITSGIGIGESVQRLIEKHTKICSIYNLPPLSLLKSSDTVRSILANTGRKKAVHGRFYAKNAYRLIVVYSVRDALFPVLFRSRVDNSVASIADIDEKICRRGRSCIRQIESEIGEFYSDDWLMRYTSACAKYLNIKPRRYATVIRTSYETNEDELTIYKKVFNGEQ